MIRIRAFVGVTNTPPRGRGACLTEEGETTNASTGEDAEARTPTAQGGQGAFARRADVPGRSNRAAQSAAAGRLDPFGSTALRAVHRPRYRGAGGPDQDLVAGQVRTQGAAVRTGERGRQRLRGRL